MKGGTRTQEVAGVVADPVCGMALPAKADLTAAYQGHTYTFCSVTCRATFLKNPTAYVGH